MLELKLFWFTMWYVTWRFYRSTTVRAPWSLGNRFTSAGRGLRHSSVSVYYQTTSNRQLHLLCFMCRASSNYVESWGQSCANLSGLHVFFFLRVLGFDLGDNVNSWGRDWFHEEREMRGGECVGMKIRKKMNEAKLWIQACCSCCSLTESLIRFHSAARHKQKLRTSSL